MGFKKTLKMLFCRINIVLLISVVLCLLIGGTLYAADKLIEEDLRESKEIFFERILFDNSLNRVKSIQNFLEQYDGILKTYTDQYSYNDKYSERIALKTGAQIIENSSVQYRYTLNSRVFMTIMELKWHLITDKSVSIDTVKKDLFNVLRDADHGHYGDILEYEDKPFIIYLTSFSDLLNSKFGNYHSERTIQFKNGDILELSDAISRESYAIQSVLALLARDYKEWQRWVGLGQDSFYQTYNNFFPKRQFAQSLEDTTFITRLPFENKYNVNSFFDHNYLTKQEFKRFDGREFKQNQVGWDIKGLSWYDDHRGVDYQTKNYALYAAHSGDIDYYDGWDVSCYEGGPIETINRVDIKDDSGLISRYLHLKFLEADDRWEVGDEIKEGELIGYSDEIGCSTGPHLHFTVDNAEIYKDPFAIGTIQAT